MGVVRRQQADTYDDRAHRVRVRNDQRPHGHVVRIDKRQHAQCRQTGYGTRQDDAPIESKGSAAINDRRILQLARNGQEELTKEKHTKRRDDKRDRQALILIDPAEVLHYEEQRNEGDLLRQHERREIHPEDGITPWTLQSSKGKSSQRAGEQPTNCDDECHEERVQQVDVKRPQLECLEVWRDSERLRDQVWRK